MAETDEKVMTLVEKELERDPKASTSDLFELAKRTSPDIADLTIRQFHARYPLQVKRRKALAQGSTKRKRKRRKSSGSRGRDTATTAADTGRSRKKADRSGASPEARDAVRNELMSFAQELSAATQDTGKLIKLLADIDGYVARVIDASRK